MHRRRWTLLRHWWMSCWREKRWGRMWRRSINISHLMVLLLMWSIIIIIIITINRITLGGHEAGECGREKRWVWETCFKARKHPLIKISMVRKYQSLCGWIVELPPPCTEKGIQQRWLSACEGRDPSAYPSWHECRQETQKLKAWRSQVSSWTWVNREGLPFFEAVGSWLWR